MATLQERIAGERRRLKSVRQRLSAALEKTGAEDRASFYTAVGDYMEASMERLHAQDIKMGNMIREKVERVDESVEKALAELDERLEGNQQRLQRMLRARDDLRAKGADAIGEFESAAKDFTDFIVQSMGHHGATTELAGRLFKPDDWEFMAGISAADEAREKDLYAQVEDTTPEDLKTPASQ